jgi:hypothetical protein
MKPAVVVKGILRRAALLEDPDLMEFGELDRGRHDEAAPDAGGHVEELDFESPRPWCRFG